MRVGQNPNRGKTAQGFSKVVMTCVTHLPNTEGYHKRRLEVIQTCLWSMRRGNEDLSMIVWDNGSCSDLHDWLQYEFKPTQLILSENIGKNVARTCMARMLPPDRIMAYSDDDIYFYPDWLQSQLEILEHFPNVSAVSGYPVRTAFRWGIDKTLEWARENAEVEEGHFIPRQWENDFAVSIERDPEWHRNYTQHDKDYRVTYQDKQAYLTAHHCQFISPVQKIGRIINYVNEAMADEKGTDVLLDQIGLRLCTTERYTRHMGNVIDDTLRAEIDVYPPDKATVNRLKWIEA